MTNIQLYLHLLDRMLVRTANFIGIRESMCETISSGNLLILSSTFSPMELIV
ncbi:hypothetical protein HanRHA438_Chr17g0833451 [Helianthus annuus]|nr:hypothetical protein HanRHA438_Chr17g0833451 [Helianthus annuus]